MPSIDEIRDVLRTVIEPVMNQDVVTLNMVKRIDIDGGDVLVALDLNLPNYGQESELKDRVRRAVAARPGVSTVDVALSARQGPARSATVRQSLAGVRSIIAVYACKGGVGKSTVSVNLATSLAKAGRKVGLLDADIHGPNIPLMMGASGHPKGEGNKLVPLAAHGVKLMSIGFLTEAKLPTIWRGPMVHGALQQLLRDTLWGELDYLIVDLPPGTGDAQLTMIQSVALSGVVFVTTPQTVSLVDGVKGIGLFRKMGVPVLGLIENMSGFNCPHCHEVTDIFSKGGGEREAKRQDIPFFGSLPIDPAVVAGSDGGRPIVIEMPESPTSRAFTAIASQVEASIATEAGDAQGKSPETS